MMKMNKTDSKRNQEMLYWNKKNPKIKKHVNNRECVVFFNPKGGANNAGMVFKEEQRSRIQI